MARIEPSDYTLPSKQIASIRNPREDDAAAIIVLMRDVFEERAYHLSVPEDFKVTEAEQRETITKSLEDPGKLMLVAELEGRIVAILEFDNDYRQRMKHRGTVWISIASDVRDKDLGTSIGAVGWKWAKSTPLIEKIYMHVLSTNERSLALCKKLGFIEEARLRKDVKFASGEYGDLIILSRMVHE